MLDIVLVDLPFGINRFESTYSREEGGGVAVMEPAAVVMFVGKRNIIAVGTPCAKIHTCPLCFLDCTMQSDCQVCVQWPRATRIGQAG